MRAIARKRQIDDAASSPRRARVRGPGVLSGLLFARRPSAAQTPIVYRVTFPEPEHHWLQVEVTFPGPGRRAAQGADEPVVAWPLRRARVREERVLGRGVQRRRDGSLTYTRPDVDEWDVAGHDGTVRLVYRIFGDHADGTYMAVDTTHAHLNMPATFMWAIGLGAPADARHVRAAARHRTGRSARSSTRRTIR